MFANVPLIKKIALSWQIIPVYFVVVEVTYSVNHYITFNENENKIKKYFSIILFIIKKIFINSYFIPLLEILLVLFYY